MISEVEFQFRLSSVSCHIDFFIAIINMFDNRRIDPLA